MKLRDYQTEAIQAIRDAFRKRKKRVCVELPTGTGKCLAPGTPILLFSGEIVPVESVKQGDVLMGPDSKPRKVLSLAHGEEEMFRVTPTKGDAFVCNKSHILSVQLSGDRKIKLFGDYFHPWNIITISVEDYLCSTKEFKHRAKLWRSPIDFSTQDIHPDLPPYILGTWLGDGNSLISTITSADKEVVSEWIAYAKSKFGHYIRCEKNREDNAASNYHVVTASCRGRGRGYRMNVLRAALWELNLLRNKHVPNCYKANSREIRSEVLAGLLDTDGSASSGGYDYISKREVLADDVCFLARSLGLAAYKMECQKSSQFGTVGTYYRVSISGDTSELPLRIVRKRNLSRKQKKSVLVTGFTIECLGVGEYFGFEIDGDRQFLLGDFTVTHNTILFSHIANMARGKGGKTLILCNRDNLIKQAADKYYKVTRDIPATEQADLKASRMAKVVIGSVQSMQGARLQKWAKDQFAIVVTDEVHYAASKTFQETLKHFENAYHVGVSATIERADGQGVGYWYEDIVYRMGIYDAIERGWLVPLIFQKLPIVVTLDEKLAKKKSLTEEEEEFQLEPYVDRLITTLSERVNGKKALCFFPTCKPSQAAAQMMRDKGLDARHVDSTYLRDWETANQLDWFKNAKTGCLTNASLLTTGFDQPDIDCIGLVRLIKSTPLYTQIIGRGTRPVAAVDICETAEQRKQAIAESAKPNCIILDLLIQGDNHNIAQPSCLISTLKEERTAIEKICGGFEKPVTLDGMKAALEERRVTDEAEALRKVAEDAANAAERSRRKQGKANDIYIDDIIYGKTFGAEASQKQVNYIRYLLNVRTPALALTSHQASRIIGRCLKHKERMAKFV